MLYCPHFRKNVDRHKNIAIDNDKECFFIICVLILFFFEAVPCDCVKVFKIGYNLYSCKANNKYLNIESQVFNRF
jgi:hypothetical protein